MKNGCIERELTRANGRPNGKSALWCMSIRTAVSVLLRLSAKFELGVRADDEVSLSGGRPVGMRYGESY